MISYFAAALAALFFFAVIIHIAAEQTVARAKKAAPQRTIILHAGITVMICALPTFMAWLCVTL